MLRNILIFLTIVLISCQNIVADSYGKAGPNVRWNLDGQGHLTFSGSGPMKDFGKQPYHPKRVKSAVVDEGITTLGDNVFSGCSGLVDVTLPSTLKSIGHNAFDGCSSLSVLTIPYGTESIGHNAFSGCSQLTEIDLPGSVRNVDAQAFSGCKNLAIVRLPSTLKTLGAKAFKGCKLLNVFNELPQFVNSGSADYYAIPATAIESYWDGYAKAAVAEEPKAKVAAQPKKSSVADAVTVEAKIAPTDYVVDEIDLSIPFTNRTNDKTYAIIISNENYRKMEDVPFAINDGEVFARYCERTLGIPKNNIIMHTDATSGIIKEAIEDLKLANRVVGSEMKVIVYYSGHGAPDDNNLESYLIPVDASRVNPAVCIPLSYLYGSLAEMDVESATVFIDACFSGGERNGGTLMAANGERKVKRVPKKAALDGNIVVFSATDADQTALPYYEKGHGMFTYFLLKKLNESRGSVSLAELGDYLKENVNRSAFTVNRREQTPTMSVSPSVSNRWQNWRLNQ